VRFSVNAEERALLSKKRFGRMWRNIWFGGGEAINPSVRDIVERSQTVYVGSRYHSPPPSPPSLYSNNTQQWNSLVSRFERYLF
jgi:hypothetical protein